MYDNISSLNLLGLNEILGTDRTASGQSSSQVKNKSISQAFADLLAAYTNQEEEEQTTTGDSSGIIPSSGLTLQQLLLKSILQNTDSYGADVATSTPTTTSTTSSSTSTTATTTTASPSHSQEEVVMSVGNQNAELLAKINNATTTEERVKYETEMRDKIVTALRNEGYTVETTSSIDEISINGTVVDVLQNSGTPGMISRVIFLGPDQVGAPAANNDVVQAILNAAQSGINMLMQIRNSQNLDEQRQLAQSIRTKIIDDLNGKGYNSSAVFGSADKITVNGNTYDFIRGLGSDGSQTQFQALLV